MFFLDPSPLLPPPPHTRSLPGQLLLTHYSASPADRPTLATLLATVRVTILPGSDSSSGGPIGEGMVVPTHSESTVIPLVTPLEIAAAEEVCVA